MLPFEELVDKIVKESKKGRPEVEKMIEEKQDELSGLVSREGAAYIVGRELGINLIKEERRDLKIKSLVTGMLSVEITVKIIKIFEPKSWEKGGKKGSVLNILVGDETGSTRLALWNEDEKLVGSLGLSEGDVIEVKGAMTRSGLNKTELSLGKKGSIKKVKREINVLDEIVPISKGAPFNLKRSYISDLKEGQPAEIRACLVQLFKRNPFYFLCPHCNGKVVETEGGYRCKNHGELEPAAQLVLTGVIDDGSGNIRSVYFRNVAEKVCGKKTVEMKKIFDEKGADGYSDLECLGSEFIFRGEAKKNDFSGELELVVNSVEDVDAGKECELLMQKMK